MKLTIVKYRLVKFGRHLVSGSVGALAGGALLMATAANATNYFTDILATQTHTATVDATPSASGGGLDDNYLIFYSTQNNGIINQTRLNSETLADAVFNPTSFATSYYSGATVISGLNTDSNIYSLTSSTAVLPALTLTFQNGANAINIYKSNLTAYSTNWTTTTTNQIVDTSFSGTNQETEAPAYTSTVTNAYTADLVFQGVNTVSGYTNIDAGNIQLNGSVNFAGDVYAGSMNVNTTSGVYFNSNVDINNGSITFQKAGNVTFNRDLDGFINFAGYDGKVTLNDSQVYDSIDTALSGTGTLIFGGSANIDGSVGATAALKKIQLDSNQVNIIDGATKANTVEINASGVLGFGGGLDTRLADSSLGVVDFNNYNATVQIGNNGSLIGNVTTDTNNNGNLVMVSGTQSITGQLGASGKSIARLVIGGEESFSSNPDPVLQGLAAGDLVTINGHVSNTTINGDVYATNTYLYNDGNNASSSLTMANGYNLNSTVETGDAGMGVLNLAGGLQTVTGNVGTYGSRLDQVNSGANGATSNFGSSLAVTNVFADAVTNTGSGTTNFSNNVTATNTLNVNAGTTNVANNTTATTINITTGTGNFTNNVTATTTNIGTGSGNFNTNGTGTTSSNIAFTGAGTANLNNGIIGNIAYTGNNATVNVSSGKTITGNLTTTSNGTGYLNMLGGAQEVTGTVGSSGNALNIINAGADGATTSFSNNTAQVFANIMNVTGNGTVNLAGGLAGNLVYQNNVEGENATVNVAAGNNLTGTVSVVNSSDTNNDTMFVSQGILNFGGGNQIASGQIGANGSALSLINVGNTSVSTGTTFNGMVYADTLKFNNDNDVVTLNGGTGLQGTADLNSKNATLHIGDNIDLTVASNAIQFNNAGSATLTFDGSSTVTNALGGGDATSGNSTFNTINAGVASETVTFNDNVTVGAGNMNVTGTGTVNLNGNLTGALAYANDGVVNVANGKSISSTVTTGTTNQGTLNFLGGTTLATDIGTSGALLKAVTFNSASNNITQTINKNIYATDVTIGGTSGTTAITKQDVTGQFDYAGATQMSAFTGGTTANVTTNVALGGNLTLANATTALNVGTSHIAVGGNMATNGGAMSFTVNTQDITGEDAAASTSTGSGQITATGNLTMTGAEKVHVNYVGSLANAGSYNLINSAGGTAVNGVVNTTVAGAYNRNEGAYVSDNSFSIDTRVATNAVGDLVAYADRTGGATYDADQLYAEKSNTVGHFSNNAASVLAGIAAGGTQSGDMVQVIQKLEIDSFGFGNNAENLATQVKKLAPIVNNSLSQSAFAASALPTTTIGNRMANLRGDLAMSAADGAGTGLSAGNDTLKNGVWVKLMGGVGDQDARKGYDGYKTNTWGLIVGADKKVSDKALLGVAISGAMTNIDQQDFRAGDKTKMNNYQVSAYGSYDITDRLYIDGSIAVGKVDYDSDRKTAIGRTASANYSGSYESVNLGAGYRINMGDKKVLTPMIAANYTALHNDAYTEKGADALNLSVDKQNLDRTRAGLGLRFTNQLETAGGTIYRPEISAMFSHDFGSVVQNTTASYVGDTSGTSFVTPNNNAERDAITVGAGVTVLTGKNSSVQVRYDVEKRDSYLGQGGAVQARWEF